jgi:hypothetical protein
MSFLLDAKIREQTDNSIARKTPGIKTLARRYNTMCQDLASHPSKQYYPNASIPPLLDVPQLFNLDANSPMWMDSSFNDEDESHVPPAYLADPKVHEGILGWLGLQRCQEEESRLLGEVDGLLSWTSSQINAINKALSICQGYLFHLPSELTHNGSPCFVDPVLTFQLETQLQTHLIMGTKWMHDLRNVVDFSKWPGEIPPPQKKRKAKDNEEEADNSGSTPLHEVIEDLELDDQHAQFLDVADLQEEDEVEKLLGKIAERCEELAVDFSSTHEDIVTLFN